MNPLFLIAFILMIAQSHGDEVWHGTGPQASAIRIELSHTPVSVDDKVQIKATITAPHGYQVDKSKMRNQLLNFLGFGPSPFTLLSEETANVNDQTITITYTLDPEIAGNHLLTFGKITFLPVENQKEMAIEIMTGVFSVPVELNTEMTGFQGIPAEVLPLSIKLPVDISFVNRENFYESPNIKEQLLQQSRAHETVLWKRILLVFATISIALIALLALYWNKIKKPSKEEIEKYIAISAHDKALNDLELLKEFQFTDQNSYKHSYNLLTNIVRKYIEEAYGIGALHLTTMEFLQFASINSSIDENTRELIGKFLQHADRIKFTQSLPSKEAYESAYAQAMHIVNIHHQ
jgi:hypothetical protein